MVFGFPGLDKAKDRAAKGFRVGLWLGKVRVRLVRIRWSEDT